MQNIKMNHVCVIRIEDDNCEIGGFFTSEKVLFIGNNCCKNKQLLLLYLLVLDTHGRK
jgi:hypothetical protein